MCFVVCEGQKNASHLTDRKINEAYDWENDGFIYHMTNNGADNSIHHIIEKEGNRIMQLTVPGNLLTITRFQFKLILVVNFALAAGLCLLTPFLFGIRYLDSSGSGFVLERFVALTGIILLTPLFLPEQDVNIAELVRAKKTAYGVIIFIRLILSLLFMGGVIVLMIAVMRLGDCDFAAGKFFAGTFATALFLGAIGFFFHAVTDNVVIGYLAASGYYFINFFLGNKLQGIYLFSLARDSMSEKYWLLGIGVFLLLVSFLRKNS